MHGVACRHADNERLRIRVADVFGCKAHEPSGDVERVLAGLEQRVVEKANKSGIGPMGFGGRTTLLGCKAGKLNRVPASYFVAVSYMCWAFRRQGVDLRADGSITRWIY